MRRDEAQHLLEVAQRELGGIPTAHQALVLNAYAEIYGFDGAQLQLEDEPVSHGTLRQAPKARAGDPASSHQAALDNAPRRSSQRGRILETMCIVPAGCTWLAEELSEQTGLPLNSVSTRMSELVAGGWVTDRGRRRETRHGEMATSYQPTYKALRHFRDEAEQALAAA